MRPSPSVATVFFCALLLGIELREGFLRKETCQWHVLAKMAERLREVSQARSDWSIPLSSTNQTRPSPSVATVFFCDWLTTGQWA
jgi:hypothetical protein